MLCGPLVGAHAGLQPTAKLLGILQAGCHTIGSLKLTTVGALIA